MSVVVPAQGTLNQPTQLLLPDTAVNDVLSMAAGRTDVVTVIGMIIANDDASARIVRVWLTTDTTDRLIFVRSIAANETVPVALDAPLLLYAKSTARKIRAQAPAAAINTVTITLVTVGSQQSNAS
jgi:hypothetical protein